MGSVLAKTVQRDVLNAKTELATAPVATHSLMYSISSPVCPGTAPKVTGGLVMREMFASRNARTANMDTSIMILVSVL